MEWKNCQTHCGKWKTHCSQNVCEQKRNLLPLRLLRAFLLQTLTLKFDINNLFRLRTRILCVLEYAAFFEQMNYSESIVRIKSFMITMFSMWGDQSKTYTGEVTLYKKSSQNLRHFFVQFNVKDDLCLADIESDSDEFICKIRLVFFSYWSFKL